MNKALMITATIISSIGAINWLFYGLLNYNLINLLPQFTKIVYVGVGIAGAILLYGTFNK